MLDDEDDDMGTQTDAASASCPRCGLTFSETVDSSSFTADEIRAVQCGANAMRVAARRVSSYDDQRDMELMADQIEAMLNRLGNAERARSTAANNGGGHYERYE